MPKIKSFVHPVRHSFLSVKNRPAIPGLGIQRQIKALSLPHEPHFCDRRYNEICRPSKMAPWEAGHKFTPTWLPPQTPDLEFLYGNCLQGQLANYRRKGKTVPALSGTRGSSARFTVYVSAPLVTCVLPQGVCLTTTAHPSQCTEPSTQEALRKCLAKTQWAPRWPSALFLPLFLRLPH